MELRARDVVAADKGGERPAVIRGRDDCCRVFGGQVIGVYEVRVQPVIAGADSREQWMRPVAPGIDRTPGPEPLHQRVVRR